MRKLTPSPRLLSSSPRLASSAAAVVTSDPSHSRLPERRHWQIKSGTWPATMPRVMCLLSHHTPWWDQVDTTVYTGCGMCNKPIGASTAVSRCTNCSQSISNCSLWYNLCRVVTQKGQSFLLTPLCFTHTVSSLFVVCMCGVKAVPMAATWTTCSSGSRRTGSVPRAVATCVTLGVLLHLINDHNSSKHVLQHQLQNNTSAL